MHLGVFALKFPNAAQRGWTLDVLNIVRQLVESRRRGHESLAGKSEIVQSLLTSAPTGDLSCLGSGERNLAESKVLRGPSERARASQFTTTDAYAFTRELEKLHPDNRHVRDKIRQQLQMLRDAGLLLHVERGVWRLP
ncbi:MAG: hypothetical protein WBN75_18595 [Verrucomicrobiia bacterium]